MEVNYLMPVMSSEKYYVVERIGVIDEKSFRHFGPSDRKRLREDDSSEEMETKRPCNCCSYSHPFVQPSVMRMRKDAERERMKARLNTYCTDNLFREDLSIVHLFVEFAWDETFGICTKKTIVQFFDWFYWNIDLNSKEWYSSRMMKIWERKGQLVFATVAYYLRFILPILMESRGDVCYIDKQGQSILPVFVKNYVRTARSSMELDYQANNVITALIYVGASVNQVDKFGNTPFSLVAAKLRHDMCQKMLSDFNNVDACDVHGETVLHKIVGNRKADPSVWSGIIYNLLSKGADPNKRDKSGLTPVHLAAINGVDSFLQMFANFKADFSLCTFNGRSNLLLYCRNQRNPLRVNTVELLLTDNCDVDARDTSGFSAIDYATRQSATAVVDRICKFRSNKRLYNVDKNVTVCTGKHAFSIV